MDVTCDCLLCSPMAIRNVLVMLKREKVKLQIKPSLGSPALSRSL